MSGEGNDTDTVLTDADDKAVDDKAVDDKAQDKSGDVDANVDADKGDDSDGAGESKGQESETPPETYTFETPEGIELDAAALEMADPVFRDLGLTNEQAQKAVELSFKWQAAQADALRNQWLTDLKSDKDLGGDNLDATGRMARTVVQKFATPAMIEFLNHTGLGNHPEFVRLFHDVAKHIGEDSIAGSKQGDAKPDDSPEAQLAAMYPTMSGGEKD